MANEATVDLSTNTTAHLIADIEQLRQHLAIESWTVLGMSWGSTLGLAYAQAHPHRVKALVLALVSTTSRREVQWLTHDVGRIFPQEWERFAAAVPDALRHLPLVDAYARALFDPDPIIREQAARAWCTWEDTHVSLTPDHKLNPRFDDPEFRLRFARLVTHYWSHAGFLAENQLLRDAAILNGIPRAHSWTLRREQSTGDGVAPVQELGYKPALRDQRRRPRGRRNLHRRYS